jgi:4'-phosphopantetheinyl transferase
MEALNTQAVQAMATEAAGEGRYLHVWWASLKAHRQGLDIDAPLSPDEEERARAFVRPEHGEAFRTGRGLLRMLLGFYLLRPASAVRFQYGSSGKPALAPQEGPALSFNLAHSGDEFVVAVSGGGAVGVDLERVREDTDHGVIIRDFFSVGEASALAQLPAVSRAAAFFGCWTRKEAYMKARGDGFSLPMGSFTVACPPEPASLLWVDGMEDEPSRWALIDLDVGPERSATVAVERPVPPLQFRRWVP